MVQAQTTKRILRMHKVNKSFGRLKVLRDISFEVCEGQVFALLGPNGSGKTTTVRTILQTLQADQGEITIQAISVSDRRRTLLRRVGFMLEQSSMMAELTLEQNLQIAGALYGLADVNRAVSKAISRLGMRAWQRVPLSKYSKGMCQKASLARALLHDPDLLILDEPMSGLDPVHQEEFRHILRDLRGRKKGILYCSHDLSEVERTCTHVGIISRGRLAACGSVSRVLGDCTWTRYRTEWTTPRQVTDIADLLTGPVIRREEDAAPCALTLLVPQGYDFVRLLNEFGRRGLTPTSIAEEKLTFGDVFYCAVSQQNTD